MNNFFIDSLTNTSLTYYDLERELNSRDFVVLNPYKLEIKDYFYNLLLLLYFELDFIILDSDLSDNEILSLLKKPYNIERISVINTENVTISTLIDKIVTSKSKFTIFTSGSTGIPKSIEHSFIDFQRNVRTGFKYESLVWGLCYNPYHIAGLNVFFQAFLNQCTIVNLYKHSPLEIGHLINKWRLTNLSGTPTFFRILLGNNFFYPSVKTVALGGEKSDINLIEKLKKYFTNAKIYNIYASTEAGSILSSSGEFFCIKDNMKHLVKVINNELVIHKSLTGKIHNSFLNDDWYYTGDIIEFNDSKNIFFKIIGRKSDFINVGGYKVNPHEVESALNKIEGVLFSKVYGQKNSVLGNILVAELKIEEHKEINETIIRKLLSTQLQDFKIPRRYIFTDSIEISRTSKLKR